MFKKSPEKQNEVSTKPLLLSLLRTEKVEQVFWMFFGQINPNNQRSPCPWSRILDLGLRPNAMARQRCVYHLGRPGSRGEKIEGLERASNPSRFLLKDYKTTTPFFF